MTNLENLGKLPQGCASTTGLSRCSSVLNVDPNLIAQLQVLNTVNVPKELGLANTVASNDSSYAITANAGNNKTGRNV